METPTTTINLPQKSQLINPHKCPRCNGWIYVEHGMDSIGGEYKDLTCANCGWRKTLDLEVKNG